jgi:hypothetical protein
LSCASGRKLAFFAETATCARRESCTCPAPLAGTWPSLLKQLPVPEERAVLVLRLWPEAGRHPHDGGHDCPATWILKQSHSRRKTIFYDKNLKCFIQRSDIYFLKESELLGVHGDK